MIKYDDFRGLPIWRKNDGFRNLLINTCSQQAVSRSPTSSQNISKPALTTCCAKPFGTCHRFWMWDASTPPSAKHRYHYHYKLYMYIYIYVHVDFISCLIEIWPCRRAAMPPFCPEVSRGPTWWNSRPIIRPGPRTLERRVFFKGQPVDPELVKSCQVMCHVGTNSLVIDVIECWQNVVSCRK